MNNTKMHYTGKTDCDLLCLLSTLFIFNVIHSSVHAVISDENLNFGSLINFMIFFKLKAHF